MHLNPFANRSNAVVVMSILYGTVNPIYPFIRYTPSDEYYVPGSPQHAIKDEEKNKADSKK